MASNTQKKPPFFFVGHSLGGVIIQDYLYNESNLNKLPVKMAGLILEGSYVNRKNYELSKDPLAWYRQLPVLVESLTDSIR